MTVVFVYKPNSHQLIHSVQIKSSIARNPNQHHNLICDSIETVVQCNVIVCPLFSFNELTMNFCKRVVGSQNFVCK